MNIDFLGRGGGTFGLVARPGDVDNVVWNASGLADSPGRMGFAAYMDYLVQTRAGMVGYSGLTETGMAYGLYLSYLSTGMLNRTGWDDPTGTGDEFSHGEVVLGLSGGTWLTSFFSGGAGIKLARQNTDDVTAGGMFADLSGTARILPLGSGGGAKGEGAKGGGAYTALVVRNLRLFRWGDDEGEPPGNLELGFSLEAPGKVLQAGFSFYFAGQGRRQVRAGLTARPSADFEMRLGYRRRTGAISDSANDLPWERGLSAGFGVGFGRIWVDYTYEDASPLDNIHRFGIRTIVGSLE
ncbi:MAG: hypothetical protein PVH52_00885 [bacterium]